MDGLAGLLDGPRAHGAFLLRAVLRAPWSMRIEDEAPVTVVAVTRGTAWVVPAAGEAVRLDAGDVAVARGPDHYLVADSPQTPAQIVIGPGQQCRSLDGTYLGEQMSLGVRTWGNDPVGDTVMLVGAYESVGAVGERLLRALPPLLVVRAKEWNSPCVAMLADEIGKDDPGQTAVLDRLVDLLLVAVLRTWFARPEARPPAWYAAQADPVVGHALRVMHHNPAHPWTVAGLAAATGVSRAALARRFRELVGEPPMSFLTGWRLALAADLLRDPDATIASVAHKVGYSTPFALSAAFTRVHGISPREHRARATA